MKLRLTDWAAIAEVISGVGVMLTLVFLIFGIRENTEINRAAGYDRNVDALVNFREIISTNDDLAELWLAYETGAAFPLEGVDRLQLNNMINWVFGIYEKAYYNRKYGVLGDSEWSRYERQICINQGRLSNLSDLKADMETVVTSEFFQYMEGLCPAGN